MATTFQILPRFGLVLVRYTGRATVADAMRTFGAYMQHPDRRDGQRHLVDLSGVTEVEDDFASLFRLQASKADALMTTADPVMMVYLAPTPTSRRMAQTIIRSWEGLSGVIIRVAEDRDGAMDILGLPRDSLDPGTIRSA